MPQPEKTFHLSVITPEASVLDLDVQAASFTAHDGEIGIRPQRAPLICKLGIGNLRYITGQRTSHLFIDGGIAQVLNDEVILLTQKAIKADEIDRNASERELAEARTMKITDDASFDARQDALARARTKIQLAS